MSDNEIQHSKMSPFKGLTKVEIRSWGVAQRIRTLAKKKVGREDALLQDVQVNIHKKHEFKTFTQQLYENKIISCTEKNGSETFSKTPFIT